MNSLDKFMKKKKWLNYVNGEEGKLLYAAYLMDNEGFSEEEYLERAAMKMILGVDIVIPYKIAIYLGYIKTLLKHANNTITYEDVKRVHFLTGEPFISRKMFINGNDVNFYYMDRVKTAHKNLSKFVGYKNSKYKPAMIKAGLVTEDDIRKALNVQTEKLKEIAL